MKRTFYLFLVSLMLYQCAQKSSSSNVGFRANPLPDSIPVFMLQSDELVPDDSKFVREIQMGQSLFSNSCGYKNLMNYATFTAKQSGANIIHLTEVNKPVAMGNGCYHVTARLYENLNPEKLKKLALQKQVINKSKLPENADYAIVYFYRPKSFEGSVISYPINMDGKGAIGKSSNGHYFQYKVTDFGKHRFFGKSKKQDSVVLNIEKGQEYYVRCGVTKGTSIAIPDMYLIENYVGAREMAEIQ